MVDISLQAVDGDSLPKDLYLSMRVGEQQKFSKANCSRTYKFPASPDRRYGKLELYRRIGVSTLSLDGEHFQGTHEMAIQVEDDRVPNKEVKYRFCLGGAGNLPAAPTNEGGQSEPAKQTTEKVTQAREYLQHHQLEQRLSEAMQAVLRERPEDPAAFIAQKLQSKAGVLKKVEEPVVVAEAPQAKPEPPKAEPAPTKPKEEPAASPPKEAAPQPAAPAPTPSQAPASATTPAPAPVPAPVAEPKKEEPLKAAPAPTPAPPAPAPAQASPAVAVQPLVQPQTVELALPSFEDYPLPASSFADPISSATLMIGDGMCSFANIGRPAVMIF
mmetsp:Transcript_7769/g.17930  ORF Transcript_7769/g.17930 Transcript_7769/m.17930 type:complete len:329 (-) Transcript_7769:202-1188(-)